MARTFHAHEDDDLFTIAGRAGLSGPERLEALNPELLRRRRPGVLFRGDEVVAPALEPKDHPVREKRLTRFALKAPRRPLRLRLTDEQGGPSAHRPYRLIIAGHTFEAQTDADGYVHARLPWNVRSVELVLEDGTHCTLRVGALNATIETEDGGYSGVAQRLALLGFDPGPLDGSDEERLRVAVLEYRLSRGLAEGFLDRELFDRLDTDLRGGG